MTNDMEDKVLYEGNYIVLKDRNGWEFMTRPNCNGVVFVLPITNEGDFVLIEQFRPPMDCNVIEICAGLSGDVPGQGDESPYESANRELLEECGYEAKNMTMVCEGPISQGSSDIFSYFFIATDLTKMDTGGGDESEDIIVHHVKPANIFSFLFDQKTEGKMIDPKIFTALFFWTCGGIKI